MYTKKFKIKTVKQKNPSSKICWSLKDQKNENVRFFIIKNEIEYFIDEKKISSAYFWYRPYHWGCTLKDRCTHFKNIYLKITEILEWWCTFMKV